MTGQAHLESAWMANLYDTIQVVLALEPLRGTPQLLCQLASGRRKRLPAQRGNQTAENSYDQERTGKALERGQDSNVVDERQGNH